MLFRSIRSNLSGDTSIIGLYAIGEVASTGVHGANRLAANSLTEAIVSGQRLGRALGDQRATKALAGPLLSSVGVGPGLTPAARRVLAAATSAGAGVLRDAAGLTSLLEFLGGTPGPAGGPLTLDLLEATNLHTTSTLIAYAALLRQESRGCHRRSDFPYPLDAWRCPIVLRVVGTDLRVTSEVAS